MEKIATQVKKAINEADNNISNEFISDDEILDAVDPELIVTDTDGITYINLEDLSALPENIINEIALEIAKTCEVEVLDTNGYTATIYYYLDVNEDSPILLRSADYYEISLQADVDFNIDVDNYYKGTTPAGGPDPDSLDISDEINVYNVTLNDGGNNSVNIDNEEVHSKIYDDMVDSDTEESMLEHFRENFDEDDYYNDYED